MPQSAYRFETTALHGGHTPDRDTRSRAVPIYQTTSYVFDSTDHGAKLFSLEEPGNIYTRIGNPTVAVLEERVAALEGGAAAVATASGAAAITLALLSILRAGDHLVAGNNLYGGTHTLFAQGFRRLGIQATFADSADPESFRRALRPETRALYVETLGNPKLDVPDLEALGAIARSAGVPLVVDNTLASPWLCQPLRHGADLVVHSATKYLGGHGTSLGGVLVDGGRFPWDNGKFPEFTEPNPSYHGAVLTQVAAAAPLAAKARLEGLRDMGAALSPFNAFLLLQGIETLPLRMDRHGSNALAVARWLAAHPKVAWVNYPGLETHPSHGVASRTFRPGAGFGGILTFGVKAGLEGGRQVIDRVQLFSRLANVGDAKSLIIHPATTTHQQLSSEERSAFGVGDDLIRVSLGLEHPDDLIADLGQALEGVRP
jgi:O-acetylhomoserine (thiol)-lyase